MRRSIVQKIILIKRIMLNIDNQAKNDEGVRSEWRKPSLHIVQWILLVVVVLGVGLTVANNFKPGLVASLRSRASMAASSVIEVIQ